MKNFPPNTITLTVPPTRTQTEVAHVYSLQPTLDEYREWAKMKRPP